MNSQSQAIEEGIKIALDAADTATSVVGEFGHIKADYAEARKQMANTYKLIATIVISSIIAMVIAMIVAGALYFKALSEMQKASNGALEGMMLLTETVDKLEGTATTATAQAKSIAALVTSADETKASLSLLEQALTGQSDAVATQLAASDTQIQGLFSQQIGSLMERIDLGLSTQAEFVTELADRPIPEQTMGTAGPSNDTALAALSAQLETILLLQKEISAKISAAPKAAPVPKAKAAAPKAKETPRPAEPIIKFP